MESQTKYCPRCKQTLEILTNFQISKDKPASYCKPCRSAYKKEHYNPDKARASTKRWAENNKEKYKEYQDWYRSEHREGLNLMAREYRQENSEILREKEKLRNQTPERIVWRQQYFKNRYKIDLEFREKIKINSLRATKKYYEKNPNKPLEYYYNNRVTILEKRKVDYYQNHEKHRQYLNQHSKDHPEFAVARRHNRRSRELTTTGSFDIEDVRDKLVLQNNMCIYCSKYIDKMHLDHIIPLAKGGTNWPNNLTISCASCNQSKGAKLLFTEWTPSNPLPILSDFMKQLLIFP